MFFRKFHADRLFTGKEMLDQQHVLITTPEGIVQEILPLQDAGENVEHVDGILSPGFINCHCHLELSHMKGLIPEKTGLVNFVFKVVTQRHFPDEEVFAAIETAEHEMKTNGIVAVGDICNNMLSLPQKLKRQLLYHNFIEASGWLPAVADTRFQRALQFFDAFSHAAVLPLGKSSVVPHAPYSVSEELWRVITPYFAERVASIHNQETCCENEFFEHGTGDFLRMYDLMKIDNSFHRATGKSSLQSTLHRLSSASSLLLVHNTFTTATDIAFAIARAKEYSQQLSWCICINANQYIEDSVPAIDQLHRQGAKIVLGTDSLASNHSLNLLDEMKTIQHHYKDIGLTEMLTWATVNGAKALEMDDLLGTFDKGKQPGILRLAGTTETQLTAGSFVQRLL